MIEWEEAKLAAEGFEIGTSQRPNIISQLIEAADKEIAAADKEIAALKTYCQHKPDCSYHNHGQQYAHGEGPIDCDCGLAEILGLEVSDG